MSTDMDKELSDAIEASISSPPIDRHPLPYWNNKTNGKGESRRAVDQLGQATAGIMKVEEELNALLQEITGHPDDARPIPQPLSQPAEGLPMFDRVRQDATALAELAIRMHAKISYARERL